MDKMYRIEVRGYDLVLGNECRLVRYKSTQDAALKVARELKEHLDRPDIIRYGGAEIREYQYVRSIPVP